MPDDIGFPEPPSIETRHRLLAEWDGDGFKMSVLAPGSSAVGLATFLWLILGMVTSIWAMTVDAGTAAVVASFAGAFIPLLTPWVWNSMYGRLTEFHASAHELRVGDHSFPWDTVTAVDVPVGVKGIRIRTTSEDVVFELKTAAPFAELEWGANCIRHVMERAEDSGTEIDIPEELRLTAHRAASSHTQSQ